MEARISVGAKARAVVVLVLGAIIAWNWGGLGHGQEVATCSSSCGSNS